LLAVILLRNEDQFYRRPIAANRYKHLSFSGKYAAGADAHLFTSNSAVNPLPPCLQCVKAGVLKKLTLLSSFRHFFMDWHKA
jgi:hypothetical protein